MKIELTLCHKCLNDFTLRKNIKVHRADKGQIYKEPCVYCQVRYGYDYVIEERKISTVRLKKTYN